jgi:hypothetical protein
MSETPEAAPSAADAPAPTPVSPYGPANGTGAEDTANAVSLTPAAGHAWVERGRRILTVSTWITAGLSVALTVLLIILGILNPGADDLVVGELGDTLVWGTIFAAPILFTVAINLLVWRALLRPLARMSVGKRVALIITMVIVLALLSVVSVTVLLFLGFLFGALFSAGSGFGA